MGGLSVRKPSLKFDALYSEVLTAKIKESIEKLFVTQLDHLVNEHIGDLSLIPVVMYKGTRYQTSTPIKGTALVSEPTKSFKTQDGLVAMQSLLNWRSDRLVKLKTTTQLLARLLTKGDGSDQETRNVLPDCVIPLTSHSVQRLSRTKDWQEYVDSPMLKAQVEGLQSQMEYFCGLPTMVG